MSYKMPIPTEAQEQKALFEWAKLQERRYPALELLMHIPNEGKRSWRAGRELKLLGLRPGVPDILLPVPSRHYTALWIELKRRQKYKISEAQKRMLYKLNRYGNKAVICYGWEEAKTVIMEYLRY